MKYLVAGILIVLSATIFGERQGLARFIAMMLTQIVALVILRG